MMGVQSFRTHMHRLIVLVLVGALGVIPSAAPAHAQATGSGQLVNGDFETGDLGGWQTDGDATIVKDQLDALSTNSLHSVGQGTFSARIGDEIPWGVSGPSSSSLAQDITVQPVPAGQKNVLQFAYAVVANDPPSHSESDKPAFRARVTNVTTQKTLYDTDTIFTSQTNGQWYLGSGPSAYGGPFQTGSGDRWVYRSWTPVEVDLHGLEGNQIRVEFMVRDCTLSGHAAYGYLDAISTGVPRQFSVPPLAGNPTPVQFQAPNIIGQLFGVGEQRLKNLWWLLLCLLPLVLLLLALGVGYKLWTRVTPAQNTGTAGGPARSAPSPHSSLPEENRGGSSRWRDP